MLDLFLDSSGSLQHKALWNRVLAHHRGTDPCRRGFHSVHRAPKEKVTSSTRSRPGTTAIVTKNPTKLGSLNCFAQIKTL